MDFQGRVALVTGAAVGIGRATALELAEYGAAVILLDIDKTGLAAVEAEAAPPEEAHQEAVIPPLKQQLPLWSTQHTRTERYLLSTLILG